jgi:hypothetical protein
LNQFDHQPEIDDTSQELKWIDVQAITFCIQRLIHLAVNAFHRKTQLDQIIAHHASLYLEIR